MQNCFFDVEIYNICFLIFELLVFSEEDIRIEYILVWDMSFVFVWSGDLVICNLFNFFFDCIFFVN